MRVLIAEDEVRLAEALAEIMRNQHYAADVVHNGEAGYDYAMTGIYDVMVLDVMLPKLDGFSVVRRLRQSQNTIPVIFLSAKDTTDDKIHGLDCGADDYLTKPFVPGELLARIRSVSRRQAGIVLDAVVFEDLSLNLSRYTLDGKSRSIHLGPKEFDLMKLFMSNPGFLFTKEELLSKVWGTESEAEDNNLEVYISFLRKKLRHLNSRAQIATVRGIGYRMEVNPAC